MRAFIALGAVGIFAASWRRTLFLLVIPLYHFLFQSFMNTEFRYGLPIHYFIFVFAATVWVLIATLLARGLAKITSKSTLLNSE